MKKVAVAVSGGRTSGLMGRIVKLDKSTPDENKVFMFANTGLEHEDTLRFVNDLDNHFFDSKLVWLEADVNSGRVGTGFKIVTYETASRHGEPMAEVIAKYGIPNKAYPHCTRDLKLAPMNSYLKSIGWSDALTAIGIRADESRRVAKSAERAGIIYPLVDLRITKDDVLAFFEDYDWDLKIPEWSGNCVSCFKKSNLKLFRAWIDNPEAFEFTRMMESIHGRTGTPFEGDTTSPDRVFFRGNKSTNDMIKLFNTLPVTAMPRGMEYEDGGCSESCEAFQMDMMPDEDKARMLEAAK